MINEPQADEQTFISFENGTSSKNITIRASMPKKNIGQEGISMSLNAQPITTYITDAKKIKINIKNHHPTTLYSFMNHLVSFVINIYESFRYVWFIFSFLSKPLHY